MQPSPDNPYAASVHAIEAETGAEQHAPRDRYSLKECLLVAGFARTESLDVCIAGTLGIGATLFAIVLLGWSLGEALVRLTILGAVVGSIETQLLAARLVHLACLPFLLGGATRFYLGIVDGRATGDDLLRGFQLSAVEYGRLLGLLVLFVGAGVVGSAGIDLLPSVWSSVIGELPSGSTQKRIHVPMRLALGLWLLTSPAAFWALAFIVERELGPLRALRSALGLFLKQPGSSIVLFTVCAAMLALGFALCLFPLLLFVPSVALGLLSAYRQRVGTRGEEEAAAAI